MELWRIYKQYKKKTRELDTLCMEERESYPMHTNVILWLTLVFMVTMIPGAISLLINEKYLLGAILMCTSVVGGIIIELIRSGVCRVKWKMNAVKKIPIVQREIEQLTINAQVLLN